MNTPPILESTNLHAGVEGKSILKGITLKRGLSVEELTALLEAFGRTKTEAIEQGFEIRVDRIHENASSATVF